METLNKKKYLLIFSHLIVVFYFLFGIQLALSQNFVNSESVICKSSNDSNKQHGLKQKQNTTARGLVPRSATRAKTNPETNSTLLLARPWRSTARSTRAAPRGRGRRLSTASDGFRRGRCRLSRHGLAQRRRKGTRRAFRKRPGDAGGRAALHPLHARQQNNIGSIGRRMDSPAAAPPSPREDGATATPPRRSPPRVSAPPLRHRRDRPE